jgi:hypothetical protein
MAPELLNGTSTMVTEKVSEWVTLIKCLADNVLRNNLTEYEPVGSLEQFRIE